MSTYSKFSEQNTTNLPWFMIFSCTPYFCTEPFKYAIFMETKTFFLIALCENLINMSTFTWLKCPQNTFALTKTLHIKGLYNHLNKKKRQKLKNLNLKSENFINTPFRKVNVRCVCANESGEFEEVNKLFPNDSVARIWILRLSKMVY